MSGTTTTINTARSSATSLNFMETFHLFLHYTKVDILFVWKTRLYQRGSLMFSHSFHCYFALIQLSDVERVMFGYKLLIVQ